MGSEMCIRDRPGTAVITDPSIYSEYRYVVNQVLGCGVSHYTAASPQPFIPAGHQSTAISYHTSTTTGPLFAVDDAPWKRPCPLLYWSHSLSSSTRRRVFTHDDLVNSKQAEQQWSDGCLLFSLPVHAFISIAQSVQHSPRSSACTERILRKRKRKNSAFRSFCSSIFPPGTPPVQAA